MADLIELAEDKPRLKRDEVIGKVELIGRPVIISVSEWNLRNKVHPESTKIFQEEILKQAPRGADCYIVGGERDFRSDRHPINSRDYLMLPVQYCRRLQ